MTLCVVYESKKALKAAVGQPLKHIETGCFGPEYRADGVLTVAGRPHVSRTVKREFFAKVVMSGGVIAKVS